MCGKYFNPRAPYGARLTSRMIWSGTPTFQSTRPLRGATPAAPPRSAAASPISIHAPLTGRDLVATILGHHGGISIHAPLTGRDAPAVAAPAAERISIHAPLTGRDMTKFWCACPRANFNPRAPYGARQDAEKEEELQLLFQSTRPLRGATLHQDRRYYHHQNFNPRAPYGARLHGFPSCPR